MSRWKMNKLGFLNFWLYDQEEFPIHDGHLLLRGNNGAGKSITTQSFITFILDGDKRPERLDPFGSRARKMEFYLLGEDGQESTGYLYLEFRKPDVEEYRTIGVGMRAQRGKDTDFWGFCLRDGRRIGPEGLWLHEKIGGQNLPLSKSKLRNGLSSPPSASGVCRSKTFCVPCERQKQPGTSMTTPVRRWIRPRPSCGKLKLCSGMLKTRNGTSGISCWRHLPAGGIKIHS